MPLVCLKLRFPQLQAEHGQRSIPVTIRVGAWGGHLVFHMRKVKLYGYLGVLCAPLYSDGYKEA
jgi:hypothetical protein